MEPACGDLFKASPGSGRWRRRRCRRRLAAPRIAPSVARFNPSGRLGELFGNLTQKLRRSLFRFGRDILFYKTLHAREFFVNSLAKIFEVSDALKPPEFFVDALAEIFEFVHKYQVLAKNRNAEKKRGDLGIIGTRCAGRKEENWRFPIGGNGAWKSGRTRCRDFLAEVTSNLGRKYARLAERWWASARRAATSVAQTCDFLWRH